jgi:hypothetical protein
VFARVPYQEPKWPWHLSLQHFTTPHHHLQDTMHIFNLPFPTSCYPCLTFCDVYPMGVRLGLRSHTILYRIWTSIYSLYTYHTQQKLFKIWDICCITLYYMAIYSAQISLPCLVIQELYNEDSVSMLTNNIEKQPHKTQEMSNIANTSSTWVVLMHNIDKWMMPGVTLNTIPHLICLRHMPCQKTQNTTTCVWVSVIHVFCVISAQ